MAVAHSRISFLRMAVGCAAGLATIASSALAQVKSVDPYSVTVAADKGDLRCADLSQAYRVGQLSKGATLLVDGEGQTGLRVAYPAGSSAFVRAEDVDFDAAANAAKLTKGSKLRAAQFGGTYEFSKSWKGLLDTELPPGTELKVLETIKGTDGAVVAYRIEVPSMARAFITTSLVRKGDGSVVTKTSTGDNKTEKTDPKTGLKIENTPADTKTENKTDRTDAAVPVVSDPNAPTTTTTTTLTTRIVKPAVKPVNKLDGLEAAFRSVRTQNIDDAELEPLLNEYKNALAELPADSRRRGQLSQRIEFLQFQRDLQEKKRTLAEIEKQADQRTRNLLAAVADVERTRVYTIIGMLLPSTVYDGTNMPLMYRIQSVGGVTPRTLGYLKPGQEGDALDIKSKLGLIVGVIGEASIDPTMQLNVVTPVRVDPLKASTTPTGSTTLEVVQTTKTTTGPQGTKSTTTTDSKSTTTVPATTPDPEK